MRKLSAVFAISTISIVSALLLGACTGGAKNSTPVAVYDFGLPAQRLADGQPWSRLALEIKAPSWFDSPAIGYRLAYEDPFKLRDYAGSRWAGAPAQLLAQRLRQQLGLAAVNTAAACLVRVDLQEFSQVFDSPGQSRGVLQGRVSVLDGKRRILAERPLAIERAAPAADARGGVSALAGASEQLGQELATWLGGLEQAGHLHDCRAGSAADGRH